MKRLDQRSVGWLVALVVALAFASPAAARPLAPQTGPAPQTPQAQIGTWQLTSVVDWLAGARSGLLLTNNAGGELRLGEEATAGAFVSAPFRAEFPLNAAGAIWGAEVITGTQLTLELRARVTAPEGGSDAGWGPWLPLVAADARSEADKSAGAYASADPLALPAASQYLQLRATLGSEVARASTTLSDITVSYLNTAPPSPIFAAGLPRRPIVFGANTLTTRPTVVPRADWGGQVLAAQPARSVPRGVIVHQIDATVAPSETLSFVRALAAYQTEVLGWEDLGYHYLIDNEGTLFEGRLGGPTAAATRLAGGDSAVHVALIGPSTAEPSADAQGVLVTLLAWLGQAYGISPTGQHPVVVAGRATQRPNIAGHSEAVSGAPDPYPPLRALLPQLRTLADQSTVRARWYFAEGNVADYSQRLSFFNPTGTATDARVTLVRPGGTPVTEIVSVPANARADLTVNDVVTDSAALPAIVESSAPILVERAMGLTTDIDGGPGIDRLSRVWYFAEGSTEGDSRTYLVLFNPNNALVQATVTYMRRDGTNLTQSVQVAAQARLVIAVNDITLPDGSLPLQSASFGVQIVASQPLAAERTIRFGPNATALTTGRGIDQLSRRWLFAEGTTEGDFQLRLLVLNPNSQPANTTASFMGPDGSMETRRYAIPPRSQLVIDANEIVPDQGVSAVVEADRPVAVERAMSFNGGAAGTIGVGATAPGYRWAFVDGRTSDATYYLCVGNPGRTRARVTVELGFGDGTRATQSFDVAPGARYTMAVHELYPDANAVTAVVRATQPIVAERSLYPGGGARGGSTTLGIPLP